MTIGTFTDRRRNPDILGEAATHTESFLSTPIDQLFSSGLLYNTSCYPTMKRYNNAPWALYTCRRGPFHSRWGAVSQGPLCMEGQRAAQISG